MTDGSCTISTERLRRSGSSGLRNRSGMGLWSGSLWAASIAGTVSDGYEAGQALSGILSLAFFVPSLAVGARRLHDCGRSGWWQLLILTVIGIILLFIWWATEGSSEENEYGTGLD